MKLLFSKLQPYFLLASIIGVLAAGGYIYYLRAQNERISDVNAQLTADLKASRDQILILAQRETQIKSMEAEYEKLRKQLKDKQNGPVADVLRFAIDADVVR